MGPRLRDPVAQRPERAQAQIVIDPLHHQHIRVHLGDHPGNGGKSRILIAPDIAQQQPRPCTVKIQVPCRESDGVGPGRDGGEHERHRECDPRAHTP